jgi:hypothetical protein
METKKESPDDLLNAAKKTESSFFNNHDTDTGAEPDTNEADESEEVLSRELVADVIVEGIDTINTGAIELHKIITKNKKNSKTYYQSEETKAKNTKVVAAYVKELNFKELLATFGLIQIIGSFVGVWSSYIGDNKTIKHENEQVEKLKEVQGLLIDKKNFDNKMNFTKPATKPAKKTPEKPAKKKPAKTKTAKEVLNEK